jgi:hypothetical protein
MSVAVVVSPISMPISIVEFASVSIVMLEVIFIVMAAVMFITMFIVVSVMSIVKSMLLSSQVKV